MATHLLWGFVVAALLAYVIPGPDWFVVLRHATRSPTAGISAAVGVQTGLIVHMTAAALGVSAILSTSAEVFTIVKLAGAAYLVFLGFQALRDACHGWRCHDLGDSASTTSSPSADSAPTRIWAQAFTANVLNAKAALFFVAVLPQFVSPASAAAPQILLLGAVDIAIGCLWWLLFVLTAARFRRVLRRRGPRMALDTTAGIALTGLGGALAATGRAQA